MSLTIVIVVVTVILSLMAFNNHQYIYNLVFYPYQIWRQQEWYRFISSAFIHGSVAHLFFNMIALLSFGTYVENSFSYIYNSGGLMLYVVMYFAAVIFAHIVTFKKERDNPNYTSLGASGGVSAIVFASILLNPFGKIYLMFIPIGIPSIVFGPIYIAYCIFMDRNGHKYKTGFSIIDNAAHAPHLWGSVFGFIFPIIFAPSLFVRFLSLLTNGAIG